MKTMKFHEYVAILRQDIDKFESEYLKSNPYLRDAELDSDEWSEHLLQHADQRDARERSN